MSINLTLPQKGLVLVLVPLLFQLAFSLTLAVLLRQAEYEAQREAHSRELSVHCNFVVTLVDSSASAMMSYWDTGDATHLKTFDRLVQNFGKEIPQINKLVAGNPRQERLAANLEIIYRRLLRRQEEANRLPLAEAAKWDSLLDEVLQVGPLARTAVQRLFADEAISEGSEYATKAGWRDKLKIMTVVATGADVVLAVVLVAFFSSQVVNRLRVLTENSARLARETPLLPPVKGNDEIGVLDRAFHDMANTLEEARKRERELQQLKQDFVAMVSHDLRTPLTSMRASLGLLETGKAGNIDDQAKTLVDRANRGIDRLINLVNDLLDIEKLESGLFELAFKQVALHEVFERAATEVGALAEKHEVSIVIPGSELAVLADEERLVQVLVNLLGNAIKFSPAQSTVEITAKSPPGWVEVRIADHGPGIPEAAKEAVFDRFRQLPGGQAKKGSSGLGLAICKAIVEQHGGTIGVDSVEGDGSTFWFRLPSGEEILD